MKNTVLFIFPLVYITCFSLRESYGQSRMIINDDAYVVMNNGVFIVIENAAPDAITTLGTGGNIISEDEFNIIQWNIGTATGNYIIPFTTSSGIKIPLSLNITASGTGTGNIQLSTYGGPTWDNDTYRPAGVTNMTNMGTTNNSAEVIDRFWIIDAQGYTTKPSGAIQFNYDDAEHLALGNTITEADLKAERYDDLGDNWELYPVGGIVNTTSNYVTGVPFNNTDFTRTWTLIDQTTHLLPLELISYTATCFSNNAILTWETASEINTDYFILEMSADGMHYEFAVNIPAAGNSTVENQYSYIIENNSVTYYKLKLVNLNGDGEELKTIALDCGTENNYVINAFASGLQEITLQAFGLNQGNYVLQLFDMSGKIILQNELTIDDYFNQFLISDARFAAGIYILRLEGLHENLPFVYSKKIQVMN